MSSIYRATTKSILFSRYTFCMKKEIGIHSICEHNNAFSVMVGNENKKWPAKKRKNKHYVLQN